MDASATYRTLRDANVLEERGESVVLSPAFETAVGERLSLSEGPDSLPDAFDGDAVSAYAEALEAVVDAEGVEPSGLVPTVLSVQFPPGQVAGTPDSFLPMRGEFVAPLARTAPASVVYVWQDDCDPCDTMRERLETAASVTPGVLCLAAFGPANATVLHEEFDVPGAPTTLFLTAGTVESRLLGQESAATVQREFDLVGDDL